MVVCQNIGDDETTYYIVKAQAEERTPPPKTPSISSSYTAQGQYTSHPFFFFLSLSLSLTYLLGNRPRTTYWPKMTQGQIMRLVLTFIVYLQDDIIDEEGLLVIGTGGMNLQNIHTNMM